MADFVNPNIPAEISSGGTTSVNSSDPHWIDGGQSNPDPTFNIDDPTFWMPVTVLSGLASGFCERAAVVYGGTVGGQAWADASSDSKKDVVSCLAANLARGVTPNTAMTNMFSSADTEMLPPRINSTLNYMKSFDAMLTKLATKSGGYMRVITGSDPAAYTFATLSTDALARAQNAGSAATSVGSSGGIYTSRFMNAYPIQYPIHRKWMLDELKYTSGSSVETTLAADAACNLSFIESAATVNYRSTAHSAYDDILGDPEWSSYKTSPDIYNGLTISSGLSDWRTDANLMAVTMSATMDAYFTHIESSDPVTYTWIASNNNSDPSTEIVAAGATVFVEVANSLQEDVVADLYLEQATPVAAPVEMPVTSEYVMSTVDGSVTASNNITLYKVLSGGGLTVSSGTTVNNVIVHSGGSMHIVNGAYVGCCTVMSGGSLTGIKNIQTLNMDGMFVDLSEEAIAEPAGNLMHVISNGQTVVITNDTGITGDTVGYYVSSGGSLVVSATYKSFMFGPHRFEADTIFPTGRVIVDSGGYAVFRGTPRPYELAVQDPNYTDYYSEYVRNHMGDIQSAGSSFYCWHRTSSYEEDPAIPPDNLYTTVNIDYMETSGAYDLTLYSSASTGVSTTAYEIVGSGREYDARLETVCPVVVLSGGTFEQGLAATLGYENAYAGSLEGTFIAYPGANVSIAMRWDYNDSYYDGILGGFWYTVHVSDETNLTLYRITTRSVVEPFYLHLTGTEHIHVTNTTATNFSILNVTGATWSTYSESSATYGVYGTTATETGYNPSDNTYDMSRATMCNNVRLFVFNPLGLTTYVSGSTGSSAIQGKNSISITSTSLYGIRCKKRISDHDITALYCKTATDKEWLIFGGTSTSGDWPDILYTSSTVPARSDSLYTNSALTTLDGSTVYSFAYPMLTGSTISLPDIPSTGNDILYGYSGTDAAVYYRCAITDIVIRVGGANIPINNYTSFRVRQFFNDPGPGA